MEFKVSQARNFDVNIFRVAGNEHALELSYLVRCVLFAKPLNFAYKMWSTAKYLAETIAYVKIKGPLFTG